MLFRHVEIVELGEFGQRLLVFVKVISLQHGYLIHTHVNAFFFRELEALGILTKSVKQGPQVVGAESIRPAARWVLRVRSRISLTDSVTRLEELPDCWICWRMSPM